MISPSKNCENYKTKTEDLDTYTCKSVGSQRIGIPKNDRLEKGGWKYFYIKSYKSAGNKAVRDNHRYPVFIGLAPEGGRHLPAWILHTAH